MIALVPEYNGKACDFTGNTMTEAVGYFARGGTGRVCLVMVGERAAEHKVSSLDEIAAWAESEPHGYLDY